MKIFVTGGTGFIGSPTVKELSRQGHSLLLLTEPGTAAPVMKDIRTVAGSLADMDVWQDKVKDFEPQIAVHLAWEALPNYGAEASIKNLDYGLGLVALLTEVGCETFVGIGTCWEYGQQSGKLSEDMAVKPLNAFTAAKNALHWLGRDLAKERGMQFAWLRLFYVYGPGQRETSLIPHIISQVRQGKDPDIKTPSARNDFIYVEDVARAIVAVAKAQYSGLYNIGSGSSTSVQEVVETVCRKFSFAGKCGTLDNQSGAANFWADISRIKSDTGWEPQISLDEGITETIRHVPETRMHE